MSLQHAILGFLSLDPMSGYDLKRVFDNTVGHFWTADQAQIYRTLSRLIEADLVEVEHIAQTGKPSRNQHRLTAAGGAELESWLASPHQPQPTRESFLLQVFFAGRLGPDAVKQILTERIAAATEQLDVLRGIAAEVAEEHQDQGVDLEQRLRSATLDNGIVHHEAEIDWARALLNHIEQEDPS